MRESAEEGKAPLASPAAVAPAHTIAAWALRMGFLSSLLSRSVLIGFNVAAGLLVIGLQLPQLCGLDVPRMKRRSNRECRVLVG